MKTRLLLFTFGIGLLAGCSKSASEPEPEYRVSATVAGTDWKANVTNSQNTLAAAIISQNLVVVVGSQTIDNTTTAIGIVFPTAITLNKPIDINPRQNVALAYSISQDEGYSADPAKGGSGTLTVTQFDQKAGIVEGTFSGDAVNNLNGSHISITNGRFRSVIYTTNVTTTPPGKR